MSMLMFQDGVMAADSMFIENIGHESSYVSYGDKIQVSSCGRFAVGFTGGAITAAASEFVFAYLKSALEQYYDPNQHSGELEITKEAMDAFTARQDFQSTTWFIMTREHCWRLRPENKDPDKNPLVQLDNKIFRASGSEISRTLVYSRAGFSIEKIFERLAANTDTIRLPVKKVYQKDLLPFGTSAKKTKKAAK